MKLSPNDRKVLVLLHGWGMNSHVWDAILPELKKHFQLSVIDLPGHGDKAAKPVPDHLDGWVETVLKAVPEQAIWLGWSLGATLAQRAAILAPQYVSALVMVTGTPCFVQQQDWPYGLPYDLLQAFGRGLLTDLPSTLSRFIALQVRGSEQELGILKQLRASLRKAPAASQAGLKTGLKLLAETDLRTQVTALEIPSLWLFGNHDRLVSPQTGEWVEQLPGVVTHKFPRAAHALFLSHQQSFFNVVHDFLTYKGVLHVR